MTDSILTRYVLDGGWSMLLLLPASVVSVAATLRTAWILRPGNLRLLTGQLPAGNDTARADAAYLTALQLYGTLQPLSAMVILAPLVGLLGSLSALIPVQSQLLSPGVRQLEVLVTAYQRALIPPFWGVTIAAFSYAAFAILRARIFRAETEIFR